MTNADRYKTPNDRYVGFRAYCNAQRASVGCTGCPLQCGIYDRLQVAFDWLALEYTTDKSTTTTEDKRK